MKHFPNIILLGTTICLSGYYSVPASAQEAKVITTQTEIVLFEPVFMKVRYETQRASETCPSFVLLLNGVALKDMSGSLGPVCESETKEGKRTYETLIHVFVNPSGYLIPKPGEYTIAARELTSGVSSNEIRLTVKGPTQGDRAIGEALVAYYMSQGTPEEKQDALRRAAEEHSGSRLARYANYHLLQREMEKQPLLRSNTPEEKAAVIGFHTDVLARYGVLASELPSPAEWHCTAALTLVRCKTWKDDYRGAMADLLDLEKTYGKHAIFGRAIRHEMQAVDKMMR